MTEKIQIMTRMIEVMKGKMVIMTSMTEMQYQLKCLTEMLTETL